MLTEDQFLMQIQRSFDAFLRKGGNSRSNFKLKPLHGAIASDIAELLGADYTIMSQGYGNDKEAHIAGRYVNKAVDITIMDKNTNKNVAGIAVKFVMQNYSQNSNNYFENMLGETANIRTANCPYFQVFIVFDTLPYYKSKGEFLKWEHFTDHNVEKYCKLSHDDIGTFFHTPNKTLIYVVHLTPEIQKLSTKTEYVNFYKKNKYQIVKTQYQYNGLKNDGAVILNDYVSFIRKVYHTIKAM